MNKTFDKSNEDHLSLVNDIILHEDDLTLEAKSQFSFHSEILHAFEINRRLILSNELLTPMGRHLFLTDLQKQHSRAKQVLNYMAIKSDLLNENLSIKGPLIIVGLPRTGSTLLYNLLACDPNCRAPRVIDMEAECVPPIARSNMTEQERRNETLVLNQQQNTKLFGRSLLHPDCHPIYTVEEDSRILRHTGVHNLIMLMCSENGTEHNAWFYDDTTKDFAYDCHKTFLCMLNSVDAPNSHWLLKAPLHSLYLDTLVRHYPQAFLIMTHRPLDEVMPSFCSHVWKMKNSCMNNTDATCQNIIMRQTVQTVDKMMHLMVERIIKFRKRDHSLENESKKSILDMFYDDLMARPIVTVRHIYDHFGLSWSDQFETAMKNWLLEHPQGKQGRHTYTLNEYGLTRQDIEVRYADYINMFLHSSSSCSESCAKSINND